MQAGPRSKRIRAGWLLEAGGVFALYRAYSWARGELTGSASESLVNAKRIVDWQEFLRVDHERSIQQWFLRDRWYLDDSLFIGFWNIWYGTAHFVAPVVTLVWLYLADPTRYVRWRNTFLWMLPLALLGFWAFPLTPPRLMPESFGFVDTRAIYFTLGSSDRQSLLGTNPFAAMPSLHIGWATACAIALWPRLRHWWSRTLLVAYPVAMVFATVVTGNHFFLDAVGAWIVLAVAYALASAPSWWRQKTQRVGEPPKSDSVSPKTQLGRTR